MRRGSWCACALALGLGLALAAPARAQEAAALERGTRIRVWTFEPSADPIVGEFERWAGSELLLYREAEERRIHFDDIDIIEVSEGRRFSRAAAVIGGVLGAGAGGALACATVNRDDYGVFCGGQSDTEVAVGAVLGAAAGAALGGLLFRVERWVPVPLLGLLGRR